MPSTETTKIRVCNRPGCQVLIKAGQLACREHWAELGDDLQQRLVFAWEERKAHPDVPELVHAHRALLLEAMRAWKIPVDLVSAAMRAAPRALSQSCPWCGGVGARHLPSCNSPNREHPVQ